MTADTQRKLALLGAAIAAFGILGAIAYGNIGENLIYFWEPTQLVEAGRKAYGPTIRLGGLVKAGTVEWTPDKQELRFVVTDGKHEVPVLATAAPPQMFREGIGVVVEGTMAQGGTFETDRLMVKHSNEYKAPQEGVAPADLYTTVEGL